MLRQGKAADAAVDQSPSEMREAGKIKGREDTQRSSYAATVESSWEKRKVKESATAFVMIA
jgi:hypothetical protein